MKTKKSEKKPRKKQTEKGASRSTHRKPETDIVLLGELEEAISRLAESPRFDFLKNLIVSEFTASRKVASLEGVTLGDLSDRLRTGESLGEDIAQLSPVDHEKLLRTISELGGIDHANATPTPSPPPAPSLPERTPRLDPPILSSVEAERRLIDAIDTLRSAPHFHHIKSSRLGDFWEQGWPRAPFEEALTLQQITEMKVAVMLEKRSFGPTKILNFVRAIERAVGGSRIPSSMGGTPTAHVKSENTPIPPPRPPDTPSFWNPLGMKLPAHATAALRYLENLATTSVADGHPLTLILTHLPATLTAPETAVAWFRQESDNDIVASLMHLAPMSTAELFESANNKISALFGEKAPSESRSWLVALRTPGISLEELLAVYPSTNLPPEATAALGRMVLTALGATHPHVFGRTLDRYYTKTPAAAELILKHLIGNLPQSDEQVLRELQALLPFIDPEDLKPLLLIHATFNERDRTWSRKQTPS